MLATLVVCVCNNVKGFQQVIPFLMEIDGNCDLHGAYCDVSSSNSDVLDIGYVKLLR